MENLEVAEVAETLLGKKSLIKSAKSAKGICEYISFWLYLDISGCSISYRIYGTA